MDASSNRTTWIRRLVADAGGPSAWLDRYGAGSRWSAAQVSQWISEESPKGIGSQLARAIERAHGFSRGTLDAAPGGPIQSESQSTRLDPDMLAESIAALRQVAKRRGWDYDPQVHASATCYVYELRLHLPERPSTADVIDFADRVSARLQGETEDGDGSREGSAAGGTDRSKSKHAKSKAGAGRR